MPEQNRIVVTNTTPIIALAIIDKLDLLEHLYSTIHIPEAVSKEVQSGGYRATIDALARSSFIKVTPLKDPQRVELLNDLDRGEAEAIALALEMKEAHKSADHLLIIDERLGRRHAQRLGIKITGTLGILMRAKSEGHIPLVRPLPQP